MHDVFGFHSNEKVILCYYGDNLFGIYHSKKHENPDQIPTYHSIGLRVGCTMHFYLQLNALSAISSHLVGILVLHGCTFEENCAGNEMEGIL